jgi:hypothetical protein
MAVAIWEELDQALVSRDPESAIGGLIKLKDPISGKAIPLVIALSDDGRGVVVRCSEAKEAAESGPHPESSLVIFEQIMDVVVGQAVVLRVSRRTTVGPEAEQSLERGNPQGARMVFEQIKNVDLLRLLDSNPNINGKQFETARLFDETVEAFHRSTPDSAVSAFTQHAELSRDCQCPGGRPR